jgi:replicative DNA helicase
MAEVIRAQRRARPDGPRVPPHSLESEESLLGALLLSRDALTAVAELGLRADDFYKPAHQHVYEAIRTLVAAGEPVDVVTVADELRRDGLLDELGGSALLLELQARTPSIANAVRYAKTVQDNAVLRRLIAVSSEISDLAFAGGDDVSQVLDVAESKMFEVAEARVTDSTQQLGDVLDTVMENLTDLFDRGVSITGTPTGFYDLDELLSGLQPSTLNIVGARPSMGKTSFALCLATNVAKETRKPVLFFSLEMGHVELAQRILALEARVDSKKLRTGRLDPSDWSRIGAAIGRLEVPIYIDENPNVTVMEIRAKARRLAARHGGLGMIVVDYLQLMTSSSGAENRQLEVSEISRGLKILARELSVPIVALSQLSRNLESRSDKRPMLSDLRESGAIEQDADVVMFIYRDEAYHPDSQEKAVAEVIVSKHRSGPTGVVKLVFLKEYTRFENAERFH